MNMSVIFGTAKTFWKPWFWLIPFVLPGCGLHNPSGPFSIKPSDALPDYGQLDSWTAHPKKEDPSDFMPQGGKIDGSVPKEVDVFFLHPTSLIGYKKYQNIWNADIDDPIVNTATDEGATLFQASAFNQAGNVYAPRYRQAHYYCYFTKDTVQARQALDLAYEDVRAAFLYYLQNENKGKPIIIASHSQGTTHALRLITEFFDGKDLQEKLVACYLLGMPVRKNQFENIKACEAPDETQCFNSWRTFRKDFKFEPDDQILVTNPISWTLTDAHLSKNENDASIFYKFNKIYPHRVDAQTKGGFLLVSKPRFPGSIFVTTKVYHPADVNFYYFSIRANASLRVKSYFQGKDQPEMSNK